MAKVVVYTILAYLEINFGGQSIREYEDLFYEAVVYDASMYDRLGYSDAFFSHQPLIFFEDEPFEIKNFA